MDREPSFHDNTIHSIEFIDEDFETDLVFDIDHITEWILCDETCEFMICTAKLKFMNVSDLEIRIEKSGYTMKSYLETILDVVWTKMTDNRRKFVITLLDSNYIKFKASSYELIFTGQAKRTTEQRLTILERKNA